MGNIPGTGNIRSNLSVVRVGEGRAHSKNNEGLGVAEGQRLKGVVRDENVEDWARL